MRKFTWNDYYDLCNKHQWFTGGTTEQYEKVFDFIRAVGNEINARDLLTIAQFTWLCTPNSNVNDIYYILRKALHS